MFEYDIKNVCPTKVDFEIEDGKVKNILFHGGCQGNLRAIAVLLQGMPVDEAIQKLSGITCGDKPTSCADQLALTLKKASTEKP